MNILLVIIFVCCSCVLEINGIYEKSELKSINGRYSKNIANFELLVPNKINRDGHFLTFSLPHFFKHNYESRRKKRDFSHPDVTHYSVHFNGINHRLDLWPNNEFISPSLIRENHFAGSDQTLRARRMKSSTPTLCHFTGNIRNMTDSRVALSVCDGLTGYIQTLQAKYMIEPVADYGANDEGHLLHVIYKDIDHQQEKRICATNDWSSGWKESLKFLHSNKRLKREITKTEHRYLEVLVVADKKFLDFHKNDDHENYILTVMNMVSDYFHDYSSGHRMDIVVVRIIYLNDEGNSLNFDITSNSISTLNSFCEWQQNINPKDFDHPQHHDIAILLTRENLCNGAECGLLGLANVASACVGHHSCAINEDNGLMLGVVVAHEIGHIMGCDHDDETISGCAAKDNKNFNHVMAPFVNLATSTWSTCSNIYLNNFFDNNLGECLSNEPKETPYKLDELLPGTVYDAAYQCDMYIKNSKPCSWKKDAMCDRLFCVKNGTDCYTNGNPPADGTECGSGMWCIKKECVRIGKKPESVPGGWSEWKTWSKCTRTCGGGIQFNERECNNPIPQNNGFYCVGEQKKFQICNPEACPKQTPSFRAQQCAEYDNENLKWQPFFDPSKSCVLQCHNGDNSPVLKAPIVVDGTPCEGGTNNVCISGECQNVGCDWKLQSKAIEDHCGICNGNGQECDVVNGTLRSDQSDSVLLPVNARNVVVKKMKPSRSEFSISDAETNRALINEWSIGELDIAGSVALLEMPELNKEELYIKGPLQIDLELKAKSSIDSNEISYSFMVLKEKAFNGDKTNVNNVTKQLNVRWQYLKSETCNVRCDGGESITKPVCVSATESEVSDSYCKDQQKPKDKVKLCNKQKCGYKWQIEEWSKCKGCVHRVGIQQRKVWCGMESQHWQVEPVMAQNKMCNKQDGQMPAIKQLCKGKCSKKCKKRPKRDENNPLDLQEAFKQLTININILDPKIFVLPKVQLEINTLEDDDDDFDDTDDTDDDDDDELLNEEATLSDNEILSSTEHINNKIILSTAKPQISQLFIIHPMLSANHRIPKNTKENVVTDKKGKKNDVDLIIPIVKSKMISLSDEAFQKLGDKIEETLDVKHAVIHRTSV